MVPLVLTFLDYELDMALALALALDLDLDLALTLDLGLDFHFHFHLLSFFFFLNVGSMCVKGEDCSHVLYAVNMCTSVSPTYL